MSTKRSGNRGNLEKKINALQAGTSKHFGGGAKLMVAGDGWGEEQILAVLGRPMRLQQQLEAARAVVVEITQAYAAALPGVKMFIRNYEAALKAQLGVENAMLRDFGLAPAGGQPRPRTLEAKVIAQARARQTRERRKQEALRVAGAPRTLTEAVGVIAGPPKLGSEE